MEKLGPVFNITCDCEDGAPAGREKEHAEMIVSRHRLIERFLTDVVGVPWDDVHEEAESLEHAMSPRFEAYVRAAVGDAKTCPHGHPIQVGARADGVPLADVTLSLYCVLNTPMTENPDISTDLFTAKRYERRGTENANVEDSENHASLDTGNALIVRQRAGRSPAGINAARCEPHDPICR